MIANQSPPHKEDTSRKNLTVIVWIIITINRPICPYDAIIDSNIASNNKSSTSHNILYLFIYSPDRIRTCV